MMKTEFIGDFVVIVFSLSNPSSFSSALKYWYPLVQRSAPGIPTFFICSKVDQLPISIGSSKSQITSRNMNRMAIMNSMDEIKSSYFEVSSLTKDGLADSMSKIVKLALMTKRIKRLKEKERRLKEQMFKVDTKKKNKKGLMSEDKKKGCVLI